MRNWDQTFPGTAFHLNFPPAGVSGTVTITGDRVRFEGSGQVVELPLSGLQTRLGGFNNAHVFCEHPQHPGWAIQVASTAILEHPALSRSSEFRTVKKSARRHKQAWAAVFAGVAAFFFLIALAIVLVVVNKDKLVRHVADQIPADWEQKLGEQFYEQIRTQQKIVTNSVHQAQLKLMTDKLLQGLGETPYEFHFFIVEDKSLNAFAVPGGYVFVHTGLLEAAKRSEEVAGVLAHEIAHVTQRHGIRNMISSAGAYVIIQSLLGDASGLLGVIGQGSQMLLQQKYSRDFEREADDTGWEYLMAAQIDPRGMIDFFKTLQSEQGNNAGAQAMETLNFLSTHPATKERIERLEAKWQALEPKPQFERLP